MKNSAFVFIFLFYTKYYMIDVSRETLPSVDKGAHGSAVQICNPAVLLSFGVRPVRLIPVPCRIANLSCRTPLDSNRCLLAPDKATDGSVLDVRWLTLTQSDVKRQRLERVPPYPLMVPSLLYVHSYPVQHTELKKSVFIVITIHLYYNGLTISGQKTSRFTNRHMTPIITFSGDKTNENKK